MQLRGEVGRYGAREANALVQNAARPAISEPLDFERIVVLVDACLDRLPIFDRQRTISPQERRGYNGFPNVRVRAGYEDPAEQTPASFNAPASEAANRSIASSDKPALIETRS